MNITEPERVQKLTHYKKFPIPYTVPFDDNGVPDFTAVDDEKYIEVVANNLCGICGQPLEYWITFIGGPISISNRAFSDPAMHPDCAEYSVQVCPYLAMRMDGFVNRAHRAGSRDDEAIGLAKDRPAKIGLLKTRGYKIARVRGLKVIKANSPKEVRWYINGKLLG